MNPSEKIFIINTLLNEGYDKLPGGRWVDEMTGREFENMYRAYEDYIMSKRDDESDPCRL